MLNILLKRKWLLLSVVLLSSLATWFFIGQLPDTYKAESVISTGIIDYKGVSLQRDNPFIQKFQIESSFSGLMEKMKSRRQIKAITDTLLAHDLLADGVKVKPFRIPDQEDIELSQNEIDNMVLKLKTNYTDSSVLDAKPVPARSGARLAEAYGYDYESLMKKLEVNRIGETDYLKIEFKSESPELSYFVVKTFVDKFLEQYKEDISFEENQSLVFNLKKLRERKKQLDSVIVKINEYKTANGLLDVSNQRETVISHIKELELRLEEANQSIPSLNKQIALLKDQIFKYNKISGNAAYKATHYNVEIADLGDKIAQLQVKIIDDRFAGKNVKALETRLENMKERRAKAMDKSLTIPADEKERIDDELKDLVRRLLDKELELQLAIEAKRSYTAKIGRLQAKSNKLLKDDNVLYSMVEEKNRLDREYEQIRNDYEEAKLLADGTENPLAIVEPAEMPVEPESKNRAVFSVFAGIAGGTLTSIFLFLLAFADSSIPAPSHFKRITGLPLVGYVNKVKLKKQNLHDLFGNAQKSDLEFFKENIRKIRTAVEVSGAKSFLFTSPKEQEGKSFLVLLLAYALSLNNKKVLVIDTNFKNNTLSKFKGKPYFEITTTGKRLEAVNSASNIADPKVKLISIVGNNGGSQSPSEILAGKNFGKVIESYRKKFDFIFLEAAAMNKFSDARELLPYVDKLAVVFSSESPIGSADKDSLEYLKTMNGKMFGGILNKVDLKNI